MSTRIAKVESLVQRVVAQSIRDNVSDSARITVTAVDVSPDMRHAIVWLGIIGEGQVEQLFKAALAQLRHIQAALASHMTTKFVPKIELRNDRGGEHAEHISRLIKN